MAIKKQETNVFDKGVHLLRKVMHTKKDSGYQSALDEVKTTNSSESWGDALSSSSDPAFIKVLNNDPSIDQMTKRHFTMSGMLHRGVIVRKVRGSKGNEYDIRLLEDGSTGCTCKSWLYNIAKHPNFQCTHLRGGV